MISDQEDTTAIDRPRHTKIRRVLMSVFTLGAALSRAEQSEALAMLTELVPGFEVTDDVEFRSSAHNFGGPERLVIVFPAAQREGARKP
jgi:cytochrome P450